MIIKALIENTSGTKNLNSEHGLSLYIELNDKKILFDFGESNLFIYNAKKMNIDLKDIDLGVLSHGHYDHGGGLEDFLLLNKKAKVYINENAFGSFYSKRQSGAYEYIGLGNNFDYKKNKNIITVKEDIALCEGIEIICNILRKEHLLKTNNTLYKVNGDKYENDDFSHEQNVLIKEKDKNVLITGCSHNGIFNIMEHVINNKKEKIDIVIGGFHLNSSSAINLNEEELVEFANRLLEYKVLFYTCHCTGEKEYEILKKYMGEKISYIKTGDVLII